MYSSQRGHIRILMPTVLLYIYPNKYVQILMYIYICIKYCIPALSRSSQLRMDIWYAVHGKLTARHVPMSEVIMSKIRQKAWQKLEK